MTPKAKAAPESVERFLDRLEHPRLPEIRALRAIVLGADRATVRFRDLADVEAKRDALADLVRQWIAVLPEPTAV